MLYPYRLAIYDAGEGPEAGIVIGDEVLEADEAWVFWHGGDWDDARARLEQLAAHPEGVRHALAEVRLLAPLEQSAIYGAAANYRDQVRQATGTEPPAKASLRPYFFAKLPHAIVGPGDPIRIPRSLEKLDWEAEIGVVIGREARAVRVDEALRHVAGYVVVNDLTAYDYLFREDWPNFRTDFFRGKNFDTSCPLGPWITPAAAIADPHRLAIRSWLNDELMQDSSSAEMIFSVPEQLAFLSERLTLLPGDVIATGTPAGSGRPRERYLRAGDTIAIEIEGLGRLTNPVVAADAG